MAKEMNFEALNANLKMLDKKGELAFEQARATGTLTSEQEKFSALISDEAFCEQFFAADSVEEVQRLFKENGLEISEEEINAFGKYIADVSKKLIENGGEISEEELEQIAGGASEDNDGLMLGAHFTGVAGALGAGLGGMKAGSVVGSMICPGPGTAVGIVVGAILGIVGGYAGGASATYFGVPAVVKGAKKLGKWIKSWF